MSKPKNVVAVLLLGTIAAYPAWGQSRTGAKAGDAGKERVLADFDVRDSAPPEGPAGPAREQARAVVERRHAGIESFVAARAAAGLGMRIAPNRYGLPKTFFGEGRALTAPSTAEPEDIARGFLRANRTLFPLAAPEVDGMRLVVKDVSGGAVFLTFNQTLNGIDVFNGQIKFTLNAAGEVVHAGADEVVPELSLSTNPRLSAEQAVRAAFETTGMVPPALSAVAVAENKTGFRNPLGDLFSPITAELSIFPMTAASARLAYRIFLEAGGESWYEILIDAESGDLLFRHNLYVHAAQGRVWRQSPMDTERQLVTFPNSWMPAAGTVTTGNNVDAYLDANGDDRPDSATTDLLNNGRAFSASQVFDFLFGDGSTVQNPRNFQAAAVTNLFYLINTAHDYYYGLGFNEAAGNFQTDNFGKGGAGNDAVLAEAQQSKQTNNASFAPTVEGTAPKIRMGLFTRGTSSLNDDLDSSYDGQVVLHEYGHGVSNRLVGSKISVSCLSGVQSGAMGEGWSDYFSISFYNNPVEGAYLMQDALKGIRRHSYEGYGLTYEDLGNNGYEVHNDGEIWAATLWDLRKALGQSVTDLLVMNGLKSTPCHPGMTDARDAILAADLAANTGANRAKIWQVFARHGLGFSAAGTDGNRYPGIYYNAAYDQPVDLQPGGNPAITSKPPSTLPQMGDQYGYTMTASNPAAGTLRYALTQGPAGMTIDGSGLLRWNTVAFMQQRIKVTVTDGKGGKVVQGFMLTPNTALSAGTPVVIDGAEDAVGYASFTVPAGAQILQVTLRNGTGDADLDLFDPDGVPYSSARIGNNETLSLATPKSGSWRISATGYLAFTGVSVTAALVTPTMLAVNTSLSGLSGVTGSESFYGVTVPVGAASLTVSTSFGTGDVDLYVRSGRPAACQSSSLVFEPCTRDLFSFNVGNSESLSVTAPAAGDWYIDMSAFAAYSGVTLTTAIKVAPTLAVTASALTFNSIEGGAAPAAQNLTLSDLSRSAFSWTAQAATTTGGSWLAISSDGLTTLQVTIDQRALKIGSYLGTVKVTAPTLAGSPVSIPVTLNVTAKPVTPAGPAISSGGIIGGGGSIPAVVTISPGGFATIFGSLFAPVGTARAVQAGDLVKGNLPTNLAGTCVQADGRAGFLTFVSPNQINFQVPAVSLNTMVNVQVLANCSAPNEVRSSAVTVRTAAASPEFLYWVKNVDGKDPVVAVNAVTGAYIGAPGLIPGLTFKPAKAGDILTIYGVSFGPTTPSFTPGAPPGATGPTVSFPAVTIGPLDLSQADILYAGVSPGIAGLYQLNIRVPANLVDGDYTVTLTLGTFKTPSVGLLTVRAN